MLFFLIAAVAAQFPVQSCDTGYLSCSAPAGSNQNSCCYEQYGLIMQTQFWDYDQSYQTARRDEHVPRQVTDDHVCDQSTNQFTIHGLWNDRCDGTYDQYCNKDDAIPDLMPVAQLLANFGRCDLWQTMSRVWLNSEGANEELWKHEYNKHGTCFLTLQKGCFADEYRQYENAVAYYDKVVLVWQKLPTYDFLQSAGITPTASHQYALQDVQKALAANHDGKEVYVGCRDGAISQIYYYHHLRGSVIAGDLIPTDSVAKSNCPSHVWYYPK